MSTVKGFNTTLGVLKYDAESLDNYNTPLFDSTSTYEVGDYVIEDGKLYRCITDVPTAGSWSSVSSNFVAAILTDDIKGIKEDVDDLSTNFSTLEGNVETLGNNVQTLSNSVGTLSTDVNNLTTSVGKINNSIALPFSTSTSYAIGDYVLYGGSLYRFTADHTAGAWIGTDAVQVQLAEDVADIKSAFRVSLSWDGSGYIKPDGTIQGYTNFSYSSFIPVSGKVHLTGNLYFIPSGYYHIGCYAADKSFLGGLYEGNGGKRTVDTFLELPSGTAYIRIADYTSQRDTLKLVVYYEIGDLAEDVSSNTEQLSEIAAKEKTVARYEQLFTVPQFTAGNDWYLEEDTDNLYCYVKAYPYILIRGGWTGSDSYTIQWSSVVSNLSSYIATSPKGVTNCVRLNTGGIFLDIANKTIVYKQYQQYYPNYIPLVFCFDGRPLKGRVISDNIPWQNHSAIDVLNSKMADAAYVPNSIKTGLVSVNDVATYSYPNMAKILWISDVHWNNDCFAYLKYLADFGQYHALIISGDLNYYQFEQTLDATKTGMSELARIWNNYYRGKTVILPCRGNHDGHVGYNDFTSEMFADAAIKPFHDCEPNGYYYYDLAKYKIRFVMLNSCDDAQSRKGFTSQEVTWFASTINAVPDEWSIISVSHHPIVADLNTETGLAGNSAGIVSAIQSFITNKPNCSYIAHLSGHTHRDMMAKVDGVEYVSLIDSSTDQSDYSADILCINQTSKIVNLLRSGQGENRSFSY